MKGSRTLFHFWLAMFVVVCAASLTLGQSDRGSIRGTVIDPNGAVVPDAVVTVTNVESGEQRKTTTNKSGIYNVPELKAANYRVVVEAVGFKSATINDVQVGVQVIRTTDVKLEIGIGASVTITADEAVINTESPVQQRNVSEREVREMPLLVAAESGGRSPLAFIFLDSSVVPTGGGGSQGINATNFRINGSQGLGQEILIDGAGTRRGENGTFFSEVAPGPNAFQEFTINTSNYSAEFGNSTGGIISFTIKSGGKDFHGEGYYYRIHESLNANNTLNRLNDLPRPIDRQGNFGFSVSGPVYLPKFGEGGKAYYSGKNKTFFFFNYEGYRTRQSETVNVSVPTQKMRNGDFSELLTDPYILQFFRGPVLIYNPEKAAGQREAFAGNIIPESAISQVGRNLVNLFPLPNQTGPLGSTVFRNYLTSSTAPARTNAYTSKVTQILSEKQQLSVSFIYRKLPSTKGGFPRFPEPFVNQGVWDQTFRSYYARLQHDYTITPRLLNHVNLGWNRTSVQNFNFGRGEGKATALGLPKGSTQDRGQPLVGFPGYGNPVNSVDPRAYQTGGSTFFDNETNDNTAEFADFVTYTRGRHNFRVGADVRRQQLNVDGFFDLGGNFNFKSNQTANTDAGNQGYPIASLLTGRPEFSFNSLQTVQPAYEYLFASGFIQDDVKVTSKLTLNVGIRYDYNRPREERFDRFRGFSPTAPNPAIGGRLGALAGADGQGGIQSPYRGLVKPDHTDFGPRLGFAYGLNAKTVIRGGYGIYYSPVFYGNGGDGLQGYNPGAVNINDRLDAFITLDNYPKLPIANPNGQYVNDLSITQDFYDPNFKLGRVAQYDLSIQRELPFNFAASVSYIGNKGTRLRSAFNPANSLPINALKLGDALLRKRLIDVTAADRAYASSVGFTLPASPDAVYPGFGTQIGNNRAGTVAQALRPFPQYGAINNRLESQGQSSYNAVKVELQRRFSKGVHLGASYTFSKQITDAASDLYGGSALTGVLQNPSDRRSLRSISPDDVPHSLVVSYLAELPFGKGRRYLNRGGLIERFVGGFQIGAIQRYRSGTPITVFIPDRPREFLDLLGYGGNLRPNLTGQPFFISNPAPTGVKGSFRYFNPAAFAAPPSYTGTSAVIGSDEYRAFYADPLRFLGTAAPTLGDFRTKGFLTEDLNILKKTRITETTSLELRMELFNLFNRSRPAPPDANFNSGNFGNSGFFADIFQPRRIQLGARFLF